MKSFIKGFNYAFKGIIRVINEERNMRVHIAFALNVLIFAPFLKVTRVEYALLLLTIALVLSLETVNSAIENLSDRVTKEKDELIKIYGGNIGMVKAALENPKRFEILQKALGAQKSIQSLKVPTTVS